MTTSYTRFSSVKSSETIVYKHIDLLRNFITVQGKILPRRMTKLTAKQHRLATKSIKQSRTLGLLPFINKENS